MPGRSRKKSSDVSTNGSAFLLPVGSEEFQCFHATVPSDTAIEAVALSSTAPKLNELMVYRVDSDGTPGVSAPGACTVGAGSQWLYGAWSEQHMLRIPGGVSEHLAPRQPLLVDMHFVNTGSSTVTSHVTLDIQPGAGTFQQGAGAPAFNTAILIPPNGMQTVTGDCAFPSGTRLFALASHTNRHATSVVVSRKLANGQLGEQLGATTDYTLPIDTTWSSPAFPSFAPGETLHYACTFSNDTTSVLTVGASALTNEMCMIVSYFFPQSTMPSCH